MPTSLKDTVETTKTRLDAESVPGGQTATSASIMNQFQYSRLTQQPKLMANTNQAQQGQLQPKLSANSPGHGSGDVRGKYNGEIKDPDRLPKPKVILYPEDRIRLEWLQVRKIGSGLANLGNTCFINSILQCLTYTAPLVNYCLSDEHKKSCKQSEFCMICELEKHIKRVFERSGDVVAPHSILGKMKMIAKHLRRGDQEDAHEFLRYVVDKLHKACLNGHTKLDKYSRETTAVNHIFGGFLRSQVKCLVCGNTSDTFDPFMDLSLDIQGVDTIVEALKEYIQPDMLERDNAYMCLRCNKKVRAHKRLTIHKPPNVLTIQLKRFDYQYTIGKVTRHIRFNNTLNMRPFLSQNEGEPVIYTLYAVLVHSGVFCNKGHYFCYVKAPSQTWYLMNDSMVTQVSDHRVFNSEAYVLFYVKTPKQKFQKTTNGPVIPRDQKFFTQKKMKQFNHANKNGPPGNDEVGTPKPKQIKRTIIESGTPLPEKRPKVSFGLHTPRNMPVIRENSDEKEKPRIVVHIKNGKVTAFEKSPDGQSKVVDEDVKLVNGSVKRRRSGLVPYGDSSDSSDEQTPKKKKHNGFQTHKNGGSVTHSGKENGGIQKENGGIMQNCKDNRGVLTQNGKETRDVITQNGKDNVVTLNGKNRDFVSQNGKDREGKENRSVIAQNNKDSRAVIQNGKKNREAINQNGKENRDVVPHNGKENRDVIAQNGKENGIKFDPRLNATMSIPGTSSLQKTASGSEDMPPRLSQADLDLVRGDLYLTPSSSRTSQSSTVGSSCSSVSVNSTTEWQVTDDDEEFQHPKDPSMSHSGWRVSLPGDSDSVKAKTKSVDKECTQSIGIKNGVKDNDCNRNHNNSIESSVLIKDKCNKELDDTVIKRNLDSSRIQITEKSSKDHNEVSIRKNVESNGIQIKQKCSKELDDNVVQRKMESSPVPVKEKYSVKERNLEVLIKDKRKDHDENVTQNRTELTHMQAAEKSNNLCMTASSSSTSISGLEVFPVKHHKKGKKHKKHKTNDNRHRHKHHVPEADDCDHYSKRHKRKKHKHKHKKDRDHLYKKKKHRSDSSEKDEKKKSDESSPEYVWVEKTKETIFKQDSWRKNESQNGTM